MDVKEYLRCKFISFDPANHSTLEFVFGFQFNTVSIVAKGLKQVNFFLGSHFTSFIFLLINFQ